MGFVLKNIFDHEGDDVEEEEDDYDDGGSDDNALIDCMPGRGCYK